MDTSKRIIMQTAHIPTLLAQGNMCVDMHLHSNHSFDCFTSTDTLVKRAKELGITFALTDHDEISGCQEITRNHPTFLFIPGIEVRCDKGFHSLVYFPTLKQLEVFYAKHVLPFRKKHNYPPAEYQIKNAKKMGGLTSVAHPFAPGPTAIMWHNPSEKLLEFYDCFEVIHGENLPSRNILAIDLALKYKCGITAGSDGHIVSLMGAAVTYTKAKTAKDFLDNIKNNKNFCTGKAHLDWRTAVSTAVKIKGPFTQPEYFWMRIKEKVLAYF